MAGAKARRNIGDATPPAIATTAVENATPSAKASFSAMSVEPSQATMRASDHDRPNVPDTAATVRGTPNSDGIVMHSARPAKNGAASTVAMKRR